MAAARAAGRHRFDLVGFSLGAGVATFIAAEYAEMDSSFLVSGFSYGGDPRMNLQFDLWLHLARTDKIALGKLLLVSGLSRDFLSAFDESTIDGIIQSFVAMSDWPLIEQNIRVGLAVDVREQAKKIKAPTLSITGKYDQIVPPFYTQELADLIHTAKRAEIPSGHLSFLEKPVDLASAMLTFLLEKRSQALRSGAVTSSGPVALPVRSSLEWYLSMISPAPIPAHRSEASRLQGMGSNLALPAHGNLPTRN